MNNYFNQVEAVKISITHRCNLQCPYCSDTLSKNKNDITETIFNDCINWLKKLSNLKSVLLYGGEPLISDNCLRYANILLNELPKIDICIFTNGTIVNSDILELLKEERVHLIVTRSGNKASQDLRSFKNNISSYSLVNDNIKRFYQINHKLIIVDTLHLNNLNNLSNAIIDDFNYSNFVQLNLIRSDYEFQDFTTLSIELDKVVDFLLDNNNKCLKNFSKHPPLNKPMILRDFNKFRQNTFSDYVNGNKNVLIDIDGNIYPGTSPAGKGYSMGNIYGYINEENYNLFSEARELCDCEFKYMCVPNYENYNPNNLKLPFKQDSHCNYIRTLHTAMNKYYYGLKERGYI